ncbi:MAG TPA: TetR/AcrR family transcriptional regulator [Mycobacteriales bacterium]|nr:TetR/AcrR family transcriptional regulator [Mycobacteriales bacterium]
MAEILDLSMAVMAEQGVAGLSLGEVARRMGVRPPSLYGYFPSKNAVYDALFERGARAIMDEASVSYAVPVGDRPLESMLLPVARQLAAWCLAHPIYAQLLFWRPVPGFTPSPQAYAPAVALVAATRDWFADLQRAGLIARRADPDIVLRDWLILISGVISQQLANGPDSDVDTGQFTAALPDLIAMFTRTHGTAARR